MRRCFTGRTGERGVTAVEFAFVAPMVMLTIAGVVEFTMQGVAAVALDFGAHRAGRVGMTGNKIDGTSANDTERLQAVKQAVLLGGGGWLDATKLTVSQSSYTTVANAKLGTNGTPGLGGASQLVQYTLSYEQSFYLTSVADAFLSRTKLKHTSIVMVKNEPFLAN